MCDSALSMCLPKWKCVHTANFSMPSNVDKDKSVECEVRDYYRHSAKARVRMVEDILYGAGNTRVHVKKRDQIT